LVVSLQFTKLAFHTIFSGGSTCFLGDFQRGFVASGVVQSKFINKMTSKTHHCQQLLLVKNVDSASQKKLLLMGVKSAPLALQGVKKHGAYRVKAFTCIFQHAEFLENFVKIHVVDQLRVSSSI